MCIKVPSSLIKVLVLYDLFLSFLVYKAISSNNNNNNDNKNTHLSGTGTLTDSYGWIFSCFSFVAIALYLLHMWQDRKSINSSVSHT